MGVCKSLPTTGNRFQQINAENVNQSTTEGASRVTLPPSLSPTLSVPKEICLSDQPQESPSESKSATTLQTLHRGAKWHADGPKIIEHECTKIEVDREHIETYRTLKKAANEGKSKQYNNFFVNGYVKQSPHFIHKYIC
jgi:hypothetical protein